jgi:glutaredoxin
VARFRFFSLFILAVVLVIACRREQAKSDPVVLPVVTDTSTGLLLTWIDEKGEFHKEESPSAVPVTARDVVKVNDPAHEPPSPDDVFVADLRNAIGPEGAYAVRMMKRAEFDGIAVARRAKNGTVLADKSAGPIPEPPRPAVIIYGASWCGPCHQAAAYLTRRGIDFVEKDIEADASAAREMHAKLAKAGRRDGSIPVIDVRGKIIIGFDQRAVENALGEPL